MFTSSLRRCGLPLLAVAFLVLQGCCCQKYAGYGGGCNSCGGAYDYGYGAGYAPAPTGGCPDGSCGAYPSAMMPGAPTTAYVPGAATTAYVPGATMTAAAPVYQPGFATPYVPTTAAVVEPLPVR